MKKILKKSLFPVLGGLFIFVSIFFFSTKEAKAAMSFTGPSDECQSTVGTNKTSYSPGETITISVSVHCNSAFNSYIGLYLFATITASGTTLDHNNFLTGHTLPASTYALFNSTTLGGSHDYSTSVSATAPLSAGNYKVVFTSKEVLSIACPLGTTWVGELFCNQGVHFHDFPFTVVAAAPTCSISYSPNTITAPASSVATVTMNNTTSATYGCTGPEPVASGSSLGVAASTNYTFTFGAAQTGTETCSISVSGPGGTGSCSGSVVVNAPANQNPEGAIDFGSCTNGTISLWGWAIDRDALSTSIPVNFYEGASYKGQCATNIYRGDINSGYAATGNHGFDNSSCNIPGFSSGNHTITGYAVDTPSGNNVILPYGTNPITINCPAAPANCNLPWGGTLASGSSVTAYQSSSVPCGSSCANETRTCNNGTLSGSYTGGTTCSVSACASCTRPCGGTTTSGNWGGFCYNTSSVPCGSTCSSSQGYCNNGTWTTPYTAGYTIGSCSAAACASCASPCGLSPTTSSNWGGFCYNTSSVPCGSNCSSVSSQGYCFNGNWTTPYTTGYTIGSCSAQACPAPTLTFTAAPLNIIAGASSILTWTPTNASSCWGSGGIGWAGWKAATGGSQVVTPASTTTYSLQCWNASGVPTGVQSQTVTVSAVPTYQLSVSRLGTGSGTVTSNPAGINCGSTCNYNYTSGNVTLTAAATLGTFNGWSGEGCSGTGTCTVTMSQARNVTATFTAACSPNCTCAASTCIGQTCSNMCTGTCDGTKNCGGKWIEVAP